MRLLDVELRRFWARRAIAVTVLLAAGVTLVLAGATVWSTRSATEAEVAAAQQQLEAERASVAGDLERCLEEPSEEQTAVPAAERCEELDPQLEWFLPRERLDLEDEQRGAGLALALVLAGAAIVVGSTFAGADWSTRSVSTQLLFRPGRLRLWATKALAVVLGVTLVSLALTAAFWGSLAFVAHARGLDPAASTLADVGLHGSRGVVLAAAAGLGAFALTMAMRSTLTALALLFAYAAAGEALLASLPVEEAGRWSLANNVQAWVLDGLRVYDESLCQPGAGAACDATYLLPGGHGAAYLGVLLLAAVVGSLVLFARRDIP